MIDDLGPRPDDTFVVKRRYSAFFNTDLDLTLRDLKVDTVIAFGVVTNICVRSTVHDVFFHGYQVIVPEDCCAATGPREQASSLYDTLIAGSSTVVSSVWTQIVAQMVVFALAIVVIRIFPQGLTGGRR